MKEFLIRWFVTTWAVLMTAHFLSGISYTNLAAVVVASLVLGMRDAGVRPFVLIITLPLNLITLGLFTFVLNGFLLWLVGKSVEGFTVRNFWTAVVGALTLGSASAGLSTLIGKRGKDRMISIRA